MFSIYRVFSYVFTNSNDYFLCFLIHTLVLGFVVLFCLGFCLFNFISMTDVFVDSSAFAVLKYGGYIFKKLLPSKLSSFDRKKK